MKIIAWTTSYWNDRAQAEAAGVGMFGLKEWYARMQHLFNPLHTFVSCGTFSDPEFSPLPCNVPIINAGLPPGDPYDVWTRQYWMCAATAAMAYALNRRDWDLLVFLDTDCLVGRVNFASLFHEFNRRSEIVLTNQWNGTPSGPFFVLKREGAIRLLHHRLRGNIITDPHATRMLAEDELAKIFSGVWWNAWPEIETVRQDYSVNPNDPHPLRSLYWPFVRQPHPDVIELYQTTQWKMAVPLC